MVGAKIMKETFNVNLNFNKNFSITFTLKKIVSLKGSKLEINWSKLKKIGIKLNKINENGNRVEYRTRHIDTWQWYWLDI